MAIAAATGQLSAREGGRFPAGKRGRGTRNGSPAAANVSTRKGFPGEVFPWQSAGGRARVGY